MKSTDLAKLPEPGLPHGAFNLPGPARLLTRPVVDESKQNWDQVGFLGVHGSNKEHYIFFPFS